MTKRYICDGVTRNGALEVVELDGVLYADGSLIVLGQAATSSARRIAASLLSATPEAARTSYLEKIKALPLEVTPYSA